MAPILDQAQAIKAPTCTRMEKRQQAGLPIDALRLSRAGPSTTEAPSRRCERGCAFNGDAPSYPIDPLRRFLSQGFAAVSAEIALRKWTRD